MRRPLLLAALLVTLPATLPGQLSDTSYAHRALSRLADKLHRDPTLPETYRTITAAQLAGLMDTGDVEGIMDDSSSFLFIRTTSAALHQIPDSVCGAMVTDQSEAYTSSTTILRYADRATVDDWVNVHERFVRARAWPDSSLPVANREEVQQTMLALFMTLSETDRARFMDLAMHPPPTPENMCWATRLMMDYFATLPPEEIGPVFRAIGKGGLLGGGDQP